VKDRWSVPDPVHCPIQFYAIGTILAMEKLFRKGAPNAIMAGEYRLKR
jgi:hypothetical protein